MIIGAIIVTYFPNEILLLRLLQSIGSQVKKIYIIDNTPHGDKIWLTSEWLSKLELNIDYHLLGENYGIAKAQNIGIDLAVKDGCDHVILFDQDSSPAREMIGKLAKVELKLINAGVKVGSVGPLFLDEKLRSTPGLCVTDGLWLKKLKYHLMICQLLLIILLHLDR
jgi:rhamnosyltransferase